MPLHSELMSRIFPDEGTIAGGTSVVRRMSDMRGIFCDEKSFEEMLNREDSVMYAVSSLDTSTGEGELHCGSGMIMPGRIGNEYFMTKGHLHAWRPAAEYYIGLRGRGIMLIEDEAGNNTHWCELLPDTIVHVPGNMAHRTVNVGEDPLTYLGVYAAGAGHDYASIARRNFRQVVVHSTNGPKVIDRKEYR